MFISCGKVQIPRLSKQQKNIEVVLLHALVFYKTSSKDLLSLLEVVWKNKYIVHGYSSYITACYKKRKGISALSYESLLSFKEIKTPIHIRSVRI